MSTALAPLAPSLYELEQDLQSLLDTEALVTPDQEAEFQAELAVALQRSVEKRDRVADFVRHCQLQQENCKAEKDRLTKRGKSFESAERRMRQYVQAVIESIGPDEKGKFSRLEGKTATFSLRAKAATVSITDESQVPREYKTIGVTLPMELWGELVDLAAAHRGSHPELIEELLDAEGRKRACVVSINENRVKKDIESGQEVPGADLCIGGHTLQMK